MYYAGMFLNEDARPKWLRHNILSQAGSDSDTFREEFRIEYAMRGSGLSALMLKREQSGISIQVDEVIPNRANTDKRAICELDDIPASVLKHLGNRCVLYITELINRIFSGQEGVPRDWKEGIVTLIDKANSKRGNHSTDRPISIESVLQRLFTRKFAGRIQEWVEDQGCLSEIRNRFRRGRRGDDDCPRAFDRIDRNKVWENLFQLGMNPTGLSLLRRFR